MDPALKGTFKFTLQLPPGASAWQRGISSNYGDNPADEPDYVFEQQPGFGAPAGNGLSIQTAGDVNSVTVTVTSRDYGGVAILKVVGTVNGTDYQAKLVAAEDGTTEVASPGCFGSDHVATLPVSQNCTDIADSWWQTRIVPANGAPTPCQARDVCHRADNERSFETQGLTGALGDGFSDYDEYRGFHFLDRAGQNTQWKDLEPLARKDVFFIIKTGNAADTGRIRDAVYGLLTLQAGPEIQFREVDENIIGRLNVDGNDHFRAGVRVNRNSDSPAIGANRVGGMPVILEVADRGANQGALVELGNSQTFSVDGTSILIDLAAIDGADICNSSAAENVQEVVAHEVGHKFSLTHPERRLAYSPLVPPNFGALTIDQVAISAANSISPGGLILLATDFHARLNTGDACGNPFIADGLVYKANGKVYSNPFSIDPDPVVNALPLVFATRYLVPTVAPANMPGPSCYGPGSAVCVQYGSNSIMSWTRYRLVPTGTLVFTPEQRVQLNPNAVPRFISNQP